MSLGPLDRTFPFSGFFWNPSRPGRAPERREDAVAPVSPTVSEILERGLDWLDEMLPGEEEPAATSETTVVTIPPPAWPPAVPGRAPAPHRARYLDLTV